MTHSPLARLHRSELAVPAIRPELFPKGAAGPADAVFLDLEDSVPEAEKDRARANAVAALSSIDWGSKILAVRVNGQDTPHFYKDMIALLEAASDRLDVIMIPKVGDPREVFAADLLASQIEASANRARRVGLGLVIETAKGLAHVEAIASASPRTESLHLGVADLAASLGMRTTAIGGLNPDYASPAGLLDPWHFAVARIITAARAAGLRPIDGPYGDFRDTEGLTASARRGRALGAEGKMAIHPNQVATLNTAFQPDAKEVAQAHRVLAAMETARLEGRAAVALDGKLLDIASIRQAEAMVAKAARSAG
ncbi:HpcH/HpaI aldolase/citrate lyase family protein [Falsiroseomonas tokyonensis]|uniref:HpcH/HpaI aldolase/citrate lyase family protein n=1 Tax=Falsiroseomonas tokyonensis TaxID=430521 RepID=A0ABV7C0N3_9PROT|nr:CoA ester lyase [Falsiroseomonas tokyonensis]MBU8541040.1 CoA ester lyase [Falsiroseomonas tokyonensis]